MKCWVAGRCRACGAVPCGAVRCAVRCRGTNEASAAGGGLSKVDAMDKGLTAMWSALAAATAPASRIDVLLDKDQNPSASPRPPPSSGLRSAPARTQRAPTAMVRTGPYGFIGGKSMTFTVMVKAKGYTLGSKSPETYGFIRGSLCSPPPPLLLVDHPPMDLGLFRKSNRPSRRGGLDLGLF